MPQNFNRPIDKATAVGYQKMESKFALVTKARANIWLVAIITLFAVGIVTGIVMVAAPPKDINLFGVQYGQTHAASAPVSVITSLSGKVQSITQSANGNNSFVLNTTNHGIQNVYVNNSTVFKYNYGAPASFSDIANGQIPDSAHGSWTQQNGTMMANRVIINPSLYSLFGGLKSIKGNILTVSGFDKKIYSVDATYATIFSLQNSSPEKLNGLKAGSLLIITGVPGSLLNFSAVSILDRTHIFDNKSACLPGAGLCNCTESDKVDCSSEGEPTSCCGGEGDSTSCSQDGGDWVAPDCSGGGSLSPKLECDSDSKLPQMDCPNTNDDQ